MNKANDDEVEISTDLTNRVGQWRGGRDGLVGNVVGRFSSKKDQAVGAGNTSV
jgi:hypothetical protein